MFRQTWNLSHTLHGQNFLVKILPQNIAQIKYYFVNQKFVPERQKLFYLHVTLISFNTHLKTSVFPNFSRLDQQKPKIAEHCKNKWTYDKQRMFRAIFYPRDVEFYTDNGRASVTNSMSEYFPTFSSPTFNIVAPISMAEPTASSKLSFLESGLLKHIHNFALWHFWPNWT